MNIVEKTLKEIHPYENNPRKNDNAVDAVAASIREFGFKIPIVIDSDGVIVAGHTRYKAATKLGLKKVPCIIADDLTEDQVKAFRLADNKVGEIAEWDFDALADELGDIQMNMEQFGFEIDMSLDDDTAEVVEDNFDEEPPEEPVTLLGDIYELGRHRLICGDSTDPKVIATLMDGETADLLLTDPPYNIAYEGGTGLTIQNDDWADDDSFINFLHDAFTAGLSALRPGAAFYIWYADTQALNFRRAAERSGMQVRQNLIWAKNTFTLGRQDYQWRHEPCLYGWKDGAAHYFTDSRTESTVIEDNIEINKLTKDEMRQLLKELLSDRQSTTVIHEDKPIRSSMHPTMKPLRLLARQIRNSTRPGELVLDIFGGSGSTLMTCEQLGRTCYTVELDPKYCDVIVERWEQATGEKAVRYNVED